MQEGALVAVIGAALAFAANALSPHRLELTKDYFPGTKLTSPAPVAATNLTGAAAAHDQFAAGTPVRPPPGQTACNWPTATR